MKALLFDDEHIVVEALTELVNWERLGIELAGTAGDGVSALAMFRDVRPDIVLTDIRMPGLDGLALIETIMEEAPQTCCIVFSGFNEYAYVKRAIRLGVTDYIEKPITEAGIEQALCKALKARKTTIFLHAHGLERFIEQESSLESEGEQSKHTAVQKARMFMEQHVARDISLQETADHVGLNASYFSALFKEVMGETYIKYLTRYRMELAKKLLLSGLRVHEVSERVGYLTHRHFTEVFKKYTGYTPGKYKDLGPEDEGLCVLSKKTGTASKE